MNHNHDSHKDPSKNPSNFNAIRIALASPDAITSWSKGEITKPETINYRTFKPEQDGLFCAKTFGPVKDYECLCGKKKRMKERGQVCDKCNVEVVESKVRRENLGHIRLKAPVTHIWFLKSLPSRIANLLDHTLKEVEEVIYCNKYIITGYRDLKDKYQPNKDQNKDKDIYANERIYQLWNQTFKLENIQDIISVVIKHLIANCEAEFNQYLVSSHRNQAAYQDAVTVKLNQDGWSEVLSEWLRKKIVDSSNKVEEKDNDITWPKINDIISEQEFKDLKTVFSNFAEIYAYYLRNVDNSIYFTDDAEKKPASNQYFEQIQDVLKANQKNIKAFANADQQSLRDFESTSALANQIKNALLDMLSLDETQTLDLAKFNQTYPVISFKANEVVSNQAFKDHINVHEDHHALLRKIFENQSQSIAHLDTKQAPSWLLNSQSMFSGVEHIMLVTKKISSDESVVMLLPNFEKQANQQMLVVLKENILVGLELALSALKFFEEFSCDTIEDEEKVIKNLDQCMLPVRLNTALQTSRPFNQVYANSNIHDFEPIEIVIKGSISKSGPSKSCTVYVPNHQKDLISLDFLTQITSSNRDISDNLSQIRKQYLENTVEKLSVFDGSLMTAMNASLGKDLLIEKQNLSAYMTHFEDLQKDFFQAEMGASAVKDRLRYLDQFALFNQLKDRVRKQILFFVKDIKNHFMVSKKSNQTEFVRDVVFDQVEKKSLLDLHLKNVAIANTSELNKLLFRCMSKVENPSSNQKPETAKKILNGDLFNFSKISTFDFNLPYVITKSHEKLIKGAESAYFIHVAKEEQEHLQAILDANAKFKQIKLDQSFFFNEQAVVEISKAYDSWTPEESDKKLGLLIYKITVPNQDQTLNLEGTDRLDKNQVRLLVPGVMLSEKAFQVCREIAFMLDADLQANFDLELQDELRSSKEKQATPSLFQIQLNQLIEGENFEVITPNSQMLALVDELTAQFEHIYQLNAVAKNRKLNSQQTRRKQEVKEIRDLVLWFVVIGRLKFIDKNKNFAAEDNQSFNTKMQSLATLYHFNGQVKTAIDNWDSEKYYHYRFYSKEWYLLDIMAKWFRLEMSNSKLSEVKRKKLIKRLKVTESIKNSDFPTEAWIQHHRSSGGKIQWKGNKAEWIVLDVIPVIPPDLRPLVPLEGGRFATSDLNELYRKVINRNTRLGRLEEIPAPEIIIRNEKRLLQEAVDALFDNGRRGTPVKGTNKRPLKSLSGMIKGKQGRFRQNLLGKRVDYSGRSVIVVGPELRLNECGLPKKMALELFKPFIYQKLDELKYANNIQKAKKMVEEKDQKVWDVLDDVIKEHPVMLNRAPTLHRLGIQAFEPKLIEGKAIQLHPLVCTAFNADFDGDQMAVHLPLSVEAQFETRVLMMSSNNILSPANGKPIITPSQDIVLGCYYMTRERPFAKGEGSMFSNRNEVRMAYESGAVHLQAKIKYRLTTISGSDIIDTTVGRVLMSEILPMDIDFSLINKPMTKKNLINLIDETYRVCAASDETVLLADAIKDLGYTQATRAGISISASDIIVPKEKQEILRKSDLEVNRFLNLVANGAMTLKESNNQILDVWNKATNQVSEIMLQEISKETFTSADGSQKKIDNSFNPIHIMSDSGARGGVNQIRQLAGMRGLMSKPSGEIIITPIRSNFKEGLSVLEYFISSHGARKGLADTALKTANSGYLTRRLVDVAQDSIIAEYNCGTDQCIEVTAKKKELGEKILGRVLGERVKLQDEDDILEKDTLIDEKLAKKIDEAGLTSVMIRSPLTCEAPRGLCTLCYGRDLARGRLVNIGETVGIIAAQSIGEPGTQLTMRTFHIGGAASKETIENKRRLYGKVNLNSGLLSSIEDVQYDGQLSFSSRYDAHTRFNEMVALTKLEFNYGFERTIKGTFDLKLNKENKDKVIENNKTFTLKPEAFSSNNVDFVFHLVHDGKDVECRIDKDFKDVQFIFDDKVEKETGTETIYRVKSSLTLKINRADTCEEGTLIEGHFEIKEKNQSNILSFNSSSYEGSNAINIKELISKHDHNNKLDVFAGFGLIELKSDSYAKPIYSKQQAIVHFENITEEDLEELKKQTEENEEFDLDDEDLDEENAKVLVLEEKAKNVTYATKAPTRQYVGKTSSTAKVKSIILAKQRYQHEVFEEIELKDNKNVKAMVSINKSVGKSNNLSTLPLELNPSKFQVSGPNAMAEISIINQNAMEDDFMIRDHVKNLLGHYKVEKKDNKIYVTETSYVDKTVVKEIDFKISNEKNQPSVRLSSEQKRDRKVANREGSPLFEIVNAAENVVMDAYELLKPIGAVIRNSTDSKPKASANKDANTYSFTFEFDNQYVLEATYRVLPLEINVNQGRASCKIEVTRRGYIQKNRVIEIPKTENGDQLPLLVTVKHGDELNLGSTCLVQWGSEDIEKSKASGTKYPLEANSVNQIQVQKGEILGIGHVVNKIVKEVSKTKDITGGLTRVAELFEARYKEKEVAIFSNIEGEVVRIESERGKTKLIIRTSGDAKGAYRDESIIIPKGRQVLVNVGSQIRLGDQLCNGSINPHDVLAIKGEKELANYMVKEIQSVYELQGVRINDKHLEVIVRQMLRRVRITEPGETLFLPEEQVEKTILKRELNRLSKDDAKKTKTDPVLLGITKASLSTESFISASSFQETTKVLTTAAMSGKIDYLRGLKENVIMGRLIPAGTGLRGYQNEEKLKLYTEKLDDDLQK